MLNLIKLLLVLTVLANGFGWYWLIRYASDGISKVVAAFFGVLTLFVLCFVFLTLTQVPDTQSVSTEYLGPGLRI